MSSQVLEGVTLLHSAPADQSGPCMYCGKPQPWGNDEACDGPLPLRQEIAGLKRRLATSNEALGVAVDSLKDALGQIARLKADVAKLTARIDTAKAALN